MKHLVPKPLDGIRIADFTLHAAGPFCAHVLSLLGAQVIKIESAVRPDIFRRPHPVYGRMDVSPFEQVAANKLSVTLNLKDSRAIEIVERLIAVCDVVIESFRPGVMDRLGLSYANLTKVKSEIVMVSISAYGQSGPDRGLPGYAPLFGAAGGLGYMTGYSDGPPVEIRHVMDHSVGMTAAFAALAALWRRRSSGEGQHVDVSAREVASAFIGDALVEASLGRTPKRRGNASSSMSPHGVYPCTGADAWLAIAVNDQDAWGGLVSAIGDPRLSEARFATLELRLQNAEALDAIVTEWTRQRAPDNAAIALQKNGVPACPSWDAEQLSQDDHLRARGTIVDLSENGRSRAVIGSLLRFSKLESELTTTTPRLGEHNDYVFGQLLGIPDDGRRILEREKVIY